MERMIVREWLEDSSLKIIFKLFYAREKYIRDELCKLEEELSNVNRFFPQDKILDILDKMTDAPHKRLHKGDIIYRARTISKYDEQTIFAKFYEELFLVIKEVMPDFRENTSNYELLRIEEYLYKNSEKSILFDEKMRKLLLRYGKKSWWGYSEKESGAPPIGKSSNGRVNPEGICYLYASDNSKTATLEVRPVISQYVSIAEIELLEDITLFDFTTNYDIWEAEKNFDQSVDFTVLGEYFSKPNYNGYSSYLATQYISEYIKHLKNENGENIFDGLCFLSSLDKKGMNYVLFDISEKKKYKINNSSVYQTLDLLGNIQQVLPINELIFNN